MTTTHTLELADADIVYDVEARCRPRTDARRCS